MSALGGRDYAQEVSLLNPLNSKAISHSSIWTPGPTPSADGQIGPKGSESDGIQRLRKWCLPICDAADFAQTC